VRQLYFSRGYSISSVNDSAKNLEKILKWLTQLHE
jgi:hypothetical protein